MGLSLQDTTINQYGIGVNGAVANTDYALNVSGSGYISDKLVFASEFEDKIYFNGAVYKIAVEVNTLVFDVGVNRHIDFRYDGGDIFSIGYDGIDVTGNADISGDLEAQDTTINQYGIGVNGATATTVLALNVTGSIKSSKGRWPTGYMHIAATTEGDLFDELTDFIPINGDTMIVTGSIYYSSDTYICSRVLRITSTTIYVYYADGNTVGYLSLTSGDSTVLSGVSLAW
jgi:hypothetical protein